MREQSPRDHQVESGTLGSSKGPGGHAARKIGQGGVSDGHGVPREARISHESHEAPRATSPARGKNDHPADLITEKRACVKCGYDLRGLRVGGRCSECGMVIRGTKTRADSESINNCSMEFLRTLRLGAVLAMVGFAAFFASMVGFSKMYATSYMWLAGLIAMGCAAVWAVGVYLLHTPRPERGEAGSADGSPALFWWIVWNRLSQAGWIVAILVFMVSDAVNLKYNAQGMVTGGNPWLANVLFTAGWVVFAASAVGILTTYFYMSWLSTWAGDDELSSKFRFSLPVGVFGLVIFGTLTWNLFAATILANRVGPLSLSALGGVFVLTVLLSKNTFLVWYGLHDLMRWAVKNRETAMDIDAAMTAKIQARISENQSDAALGRAARGPRV